MNASPRICLGIAAALITASLAAAQPATRPDGVRHEEIASPPVTGMCLSEDRQYLLTTHQKSDALQVWDVAKGTPIKKMACPGAKAILCRDGRVFVGCHGKGVIRVFASAPDWKYIDELEAGGPNVVALSAPQDKNWDGRLMTLTSDQNRSRVHLLNAKEDKHREILDTSDSGSVVFVNSSHVLIQPLGGSPSGIPRHYELASSAGVPGAPTAATQQLKHQRFYALHQDYPCLQQVSGSSLWFGGGSVHGGWPVRRLNSWKDSIVVPDPPRRLIYVVDAATVKAVSMDLRLAEVGVRSINQALKGLEGYGGGWFQESGAPLQASVATTIGDTLYIHYVLANGSLHRLAARAFDPMPASPIEAPIAILPAEDVPSSMALTEDGRELVVAHELANVVTVWDVVTGKQIRNIVCKSPRFVLCRGEKAYVANYGRGTISVLSRSEGWKLTDELAAGQSNVCYLSAPRGSSFQGTILACGESVCAVDTAKDTHKVLYRNVAEMATVSADGGSVMRQAGYDPRNGLFHASELCRYDEYVSGTMAALVPRNDYLPMLAQTQRGPLWLGPVSAYSGALLKPQAAPDSATLALAPDETSRLLHELQKETLITRSLDGAMGIRRRQFLRWPLPPNDSSFQRMDFSLAAGVEGGGNYVVTTPVAATVGQTSYAFFIDPVWNRLIRCQSSGAVKAASRSTGTANPALSMSPLSTILYRHGGPSSEAIQPAPLPSAGEVSHQ